MGGSGSRNKRSHTDGLEEAAKKMMMQRRREEPSQWFDPDDADLPKTRSVFARVGEEGFIDFRDVGTHGLLASVKEDGMIWDLLYLGGCVFVCSRVGGPPRLHVVRYLSREAAARLEGDVMPETFHGVAGVLRTIPSSIPHADEFRSLCAAPIDSGYDDSAILEAFAVCGDDGKVELFRTSTMESIGVFDTTPEGEKDPFVSNCFAVGYCHPLGWICCAGALSTAGDDANILCCDVRTSHACAHFTKAPLEGMETASSTIYKLHCLQRSTVAYAIGTHPTACVWGVDFRLPQGETAFWASPDVETEEKTSSYTDLVYREDSHQIVAVGGYGKVMFHETRKNLLPSDGFTIHEEGSIASISEITIDDSSHSLCFVTSSAWAWDGNDSIKTWYVGDPDVPPGGGGSSMFPSTEKCVPSALKTAASAVVVKDTFLLERKHHWAVRHMGVRGGYRESSVLSDGDLNEKIRFLVGLRDVGPFCSCSVRMTSGVCVSCFCSALVEVV